MCLRGDGLKSSMSPIMYPRKCRLALCPTLCCPHTPWTQVPALEIGLEVIHPISAIKNESKMDHLLKKKKCFR